ncbi:hypothetical protein [Aureibaculum conchae]|uniref:hypothetical protein n=1 Tax=Aureibaculum sp. 2308TA14-22 TaxID=3108392 RepID=UPI00339A36D8
MKKGCKITLIIIAFIFIGGLIGGYYFLKKLGEAFGAECELTNEWTFKEYQIKEYRCIGWAGPPWYPMDIYKDGKEIASDVIRQDSCLIRFRKNKQQYVDLNTCENSVNTFKADKTLLNLSAIDSIRIYSNKENRTKMLNKSETKRIVRDWNTSKVFDFRDKPFDSIFYPDFDYKLYIYQYGQKTEFITGSHLMAGKNNWTYLMSPEMDTDYFNNIWNEE